jgi:hypothetical protein
MASWDDEDLDLDFDLDVDDDCEDDDDCGEFCNYCDGFEDECCCGEPNEGCCD